MHSEQSLGYIRVILLHTVAQREQCLNENRALSIEISVSYQVDLPVNVFTDIGFYIIVLVHILFDLMPLLDYKPLVYYIFYLLLDFFALFL